MTGEHLEEKIAFAGHRPRHDGSGAFGLEIEFSRFRGLKRPDEIPILKRTVSPGRPSRDGIFPAPIFLFPDHNITRADAGISAFKRVLRIQVELGPRRPRIPFVRSLTCGKTFSGGAEIFAERVTLNSSGCSGDDDDEQMAMNARARRIAAINFLSI